MPRVAALYIASLAAHFDYLPRVHDDDDIARWFASHPASDRITWLAEDGETLLGYVSITPGWVQHLYVATGAQRRGVGTVLLAHVTADATPRALYAFQQNLTGNRFYLRHGWRPVEHTDGAGNEERTPDTRYAWPPSPAETLSLRRPAPELVPDFIAALNAGWSPNSGRDTRAATRESLDRDPAAFLAELNGGTGRVILPDGTEVDRLPGGVFWLWDGAFCGSINLRYLPGTHELPAHVSGHIGYVVVPWKQRRGIATAALAAILAHARDAGLRRVSLTCDTDNGGSRKVIEANGGVLDGPAPPNKLLFWIDLFPST